MNILNDSYGNIDSGQSTLLVAPYLSAAFDTVEHLVLLTRLQNSIGVTRMVGKGITSCLTDHSQFIHVGSESSAVTDCSCDVPQGSVLGPLFFVAYYSPVACIANKFGVFLSQYADDTQLYVALSQKAVNDTVTNLQNCLFDVNTWFRQNRKILSGALINYTAC